MGSVLHTIEHPEGEAYTGAIGYGNVVVGFWETCAKMRYHFFNLGERLQFLLSFYGVFHPNQSIFLRKIGEFLLVI